MFARALLAFLLLPGIVAYALPLAWLAWSDATLRWPWALLAVIAGSAGLLWCVRDFYVSGKGTLAPWAPPRELVIVGLYRVSRNPMYVCVSLVLVGWAVAFASPPLAFYAGVVALAFHWRVVCGEEPWLARTHGPAWQRYARRVRRWF